MKAVFELDKVYSLKEVATKLRVDRRTISKEKELPAIKVGSQLRFLGKDLNNYFRRK